VQYSKGHRNKGLPITTIGKGTFPTTPITEDKIHFRFDYFDANHSHFEGSQFTNEWPNKLLNKLKHLQRLTVDYFKTDMQFRQSQYVHPIKWGGAKLKGFGIQNFEYDADAWQFGLSKAAGRIHGFFIKNLFYIVWLDPEHRLFEYRNPTDN
jgi:hypothetical protein